MDIFKADKTHHAWPFYDIFDIHKIIFYHGLRKTFFFFKHFFYFWKNPFLRFLFKIYQGRDYKTDMPQQKPQHLPTVDMNFDGCKVTQNDVFQALWKIDNWIFSYYGMKLQDINLENLIKYCLEIFCAKYQQHKGWKWLKWFFFRKGLCRGIWANCGGKWFFKVL